MPSNDVGAHLYLVLLIIHRLPEDLDVELPDGLGVTPLVRPPTHVELRTDGPKIVEGIDDLVHARPTRAQGIGVATTPTGSSTTTSSPSWARHDLLCAKGCGRNDLLDIRVEMLGLKKRVVVNTFQAYPGNLRVVPCIRVRRRVSKHLVLQLVDCSFHVKDVV